MDLLGWENWRNWADQFEKKHANPWTQAEILERVKRLEKLHWTWCAAGIVLSALGGGILPINAVIGCFVIILGVMLISATKLASSNALCTFQILWDMRKREDEAVRESEIQDL